MLTRTKELVGENGIEKIKNANICVVGIGGVGGMVCEILARTGISNLTLIDFDKVEKSNINRQIIALNSTIGENKAILMAKRIADINIGCKVKTITERLTAENAQNFIPPKTNFVVDCIDNITDKISLICYCKKNNIPIISALGTGNRLGIPQYEIIDIFKTSNDGIAKVLRKKLRENNIQNLDVAVSKMGADIKQQNPASVMWHPAVCGSVLSAFVINKILENHE